MFNKSRIQERLAELGFDWVFEKRNWPGNRFCIYRKEQQNRPVDTFVFCNNRTESTAFGLV